MSIDLDGAAERWQRDGWALIDSLVPSEVVKTARTEIGENAAVANSATNPSRQRRKPAPDDELAFRSEQFSGTSQFPYPDAPNINRLFVRPELVDFAERALGTRDIRIYQSRVWSKHAGRANYEQPLHRDLNHSLVPTRSEPGWWHLECFLYLTDVDEGSGAPKLVPRSAVDEPPIDRRSMSRSEAPELYAAEVSAVGSAGSLLAYRSDVWHRGVDITRPGAERHVLVVAFKPAGTDWIGYDPHPPLAVNEDFIRFAETCTPRELALFGVPEPGHPYWTVDMVEEMQRAYPGLDLSPWQAALS